MAISRDDPFYSAKRRLVRAQKHVANLDREISRFLYNKPYKITVELDADGTYETHKFTFTKRLPAICDDLAFEAMFTLRSVLDQTAYAAAAASGKVRPKRASFVIRDDAAGFENSLRGWPGDLPDEIKTLFRQLKPYKGGNDALWTLNKLRNSAHTALIAVTVAGASVDIRHARYSAALDRLDPVWDSVKNEIAFARGKRGQKWDYEVRSTLAIGFDEIDLGVPQPAVTILNAAGHEIINILLAAEAKCRDLGFIK